MTFANGLSMLTLLAKMNVCSLWKQSLRLFLSCHAPKSGEIIADVATVQL